MWIVELDWSARGADEAAGEKPAMRASDVVATAGTNSGDADAIAERTEVL